MKALSLVVLVLTFLGCQTEMATIDLSAIENTFNCHAGYSTHLTLDLKESVKRLDVEITGFKSENETKARENNNMIALLALKEIENQDFSDIIIKNLYTNQGKIDTMHLSYKPKQLKPVLKKYKRLKNLLDSSVVIEHGYSHLLDKIDPIYQNKKAFSQFIANSKSQDSAYGKIEKYKITGMLSGNIDKRGTKVGAIEFNGIAQRQKAEQEVFFTIYKNEENPYINTIHFKTIKN